MAEVRPMQYQVLVQNPSEQRFIASVVGLSNVIAEGTTEEEVIARVKTALVSQLATAKLVTIEIDAAQEPLGKFQAKHAGVLAHDPTFDDWMEKMSVIRQQQNEVRDDE
jgi:predicted RNase H-like HicB family nuclease